MKKTNAPKKLFTSLTLVCLALAGALPVRASLTNGLVAYWPMDNVVGCNNQTPDVIHGYNLQPVWGIPFSSGLFPTNFNANLYLTNDAVRGNAVFVDNSASGNTQFAMLFTSANTNDLVPVNRYSPSSNTVSFWMKTAGTHPAPNNDQRVWAETSYPKNLAAVFDLSPVNASYDVFVRQNGPGGSSTNYGNFSGGSHYTGGATVADGAWHNVTIVTTPSSPGANLTATWTIYVDGVLDAGFNNVGSVTKSDGLWNLDTVGLFALVRSGTPAGFITQCAVDDLAEWSRVLDPAEILDYMANGITNVPSAITPVRINRFSSDLYGVVQGSQAVLSWQVSSDATGISIDHGVGNVLPISTCGSGSTNITVNGNTTYTLTVTRGTEIVAQQLSITTVTGVANNWNYVGGFNEFAASNNLASQGNWVSLFSSPQTATLEPAVVLPTVSGNHVLGMAGSPVLSYGQFGHNSIGINGTNTLFFRFYIDPSIDTILSTNPADPNFNVIADADLGVGVSDVGPFDVDTFTGSDKGPAVRIYRNTSGTGGPIDLTANFGPGSSSGFSWMASVDAGGLKTGVVYNVWIDVANPTNDVAANAANYYGVTVQVGGDTGSVTNLFADQASDSNLNHPTETLDKVFVAASKGLSDQSTNAIRFDDFYLSSGGYNHTLPVPEGSFVVGAPVTPPVIQISGVTRTGNSVTLSWSTSATSPATYSVWSRAALDAGSWTTMASGLTGTNYTDTTASGPRGFYRVSSP